LARVIDIHAHAFPANIAEKAAKALGEFYHFTVENEASCDALAESAKAAGVEKVIIHSTATVPRQVKDVNNFLKSCESELFIPFGSIHPNYDEIEKELDRICMLGLKGLKLHPDFQEFDADEKKAIRIYKAWEKTSLPLLIHGGDPVREYSLPQKIARIKDYCPDMVVIVAHLGGYRRLEEADKYLIGKDFYIDTSSSLWYIPKQDVVSIIRKHGADRVLFGTDYPVVKHTEELERFYNLGLTEEENEKILYSNAKRLLRLK